MELAKTIGPVFIVFNGIMALGCVQMLLDGFRPLKTALLLALNLLVVGYFIFMLVNTPRPEGRNE